ncbi:MAG: metallophosphoesterase [Candidatus Aenigmarchaeota archaeon]|nr:metallophosphoesterase [Candidatus Aenigmarchaeota archaeon]
MLEKQRAVIKAMMSQQVLVTKQILDELYNKTKLEEYFNLYVLKEPHLQQVQTIPVQTIQSFNSHSVSTVSQYFEEPKKWSIQDFVQLFNSRLKTLGKLLQTRLTNLTSISRLKQLQNEQISIIGIVSDKQTTKKENIILTIEDMSGGQIKAIITKNKQEVYNNAKDIVLDEIIGISGTAGNDALFVNNIIFPDIPITTELKKSPKEEYAVILSDVHIGSKLFLEQEFNEFIKWTQGKIGTDEQKKMAEKTEYIFIVGDLVDGVGIYPSQEKELAITDIYKQYQDAAKLLLQIPQNKKIIICPGNHDAVRIAEPQPVLPKDICAPLWNLPNTLMLTNPSIARIGTTTDFPGFDVLMYHGYSYDYYGNVVESIKNSGRHISDKTDLIMKFLLQKRHLAPTHTSTLYIPNPKKDPLIIETVPDIFVSGHVHRAAVNTYHGVTIIVSSCFQAKTGFQEKVGHEPTPCHVPIINLQTRKVTIMNFEKTSTNQILTENINNEHN